MRTTDAVGRLPTRVRQCNKLDAKHSDTLPKKKKKKKVAGARGACFLSVVRGPLR